MRFSKSKDLERKLDREVDTVRGLLGQLEGILQNINSAKPHNSDTKEPTYWTPEIEGCKEGDWQYNVDETWGNTILKSSFTDWPFYMVISKKYKLTRPIGANPRVEHSPHSFRFEIGIEREKSPCQHKDIIIFMAPMPDNRHISTIGTVFKEFDDQLSVLAVTFTTETKPQESTHRKRWEFGFDFDLNDRIKAKTLSRATSMMLSVGKPTMDCALGRGTENPWDKLAADKQLGIDKWYDLGDERNVPVTMVDETMWRVAAVGYKAAPQTGLDKVKALWKK
jgi:hypothetical protein